MRKYMNVPIGSYSYHGVAYYLNGAQITAMDAGIFPPLVLNIPGSAVAQSIPAAVYPWL